jgi:hypothetical protein
VLGMACAAVSAILAILVVRRLGERQERCRDAQEQAGHASGDSLRAGDVLTGERS